MSDSCSSGSILYWSWHKPQVDVRNFPEEPIGPIICNLEGFYLFGGGSSGHHYMWEVSS
ncbi:hypothetical protein ZOSMA_188G00140 [Zostera marina]|uniref:Uncharacterized protein n=1 Tax=Zostera marina TaxID=29655 RepID=A0A0K9PQ99_ZOSMR|nr:hypothetical protein ZOSMA_188G00140 [Zostera marina]